MNIKDTVGVTVGIMTIIGMVFGAVAMMAKWIGRKAAEFVNEKVMPPVESLTLSVDNLATSTHENTRTIESFTRSQSEINERISGEVAELRGAFNTLVTGRRHIHPPTVLGDQSEPL